MSVARQRIVISLLIVALFIPLSTADAAQPKFGWEVLRALALRLDKAIDSLPETTIVLTPDNLVDWLHEIVPYFEENGAITSAHWPKEASTEFYADARGALHIGGQSNCTDWVKVNERFIRSTSAWYGRIGALAVLTHELAHMQQGKLCETLPTEDIETTAQIMAIEVMASMTLSGNKPMRAALLDELFDMTMGAAWSYGLTDEYRTAYTALESQVYSKPFERARMARARLSWRGREIELRGILRAYNLMPMRLMMESYWTGKPIVSEAIPSGKLAMDDLSYVLDHLEELSRDR